ncbi:hypothetical protein LNQ03_18965 [Klebsiella pneumoniae subsp. pneumoniae]|nr:hypothetical protein [Klebsiella pneumoniae subsp. pneumoniae]
MKRFCRPTPGCRCAGGHGLYRPAQRRLPGRVAVFEPGRGPRRRRLGDPSSAGGRCAVLRPAGGAQQAYKARAISARRWRSPRRWRSRAGRRSASAKLFRADVLRHNKDLPQAEQTLRSLLNDDPQNAAARENLYPRAAREQNKSAEAQAMLQTLPQSLRQKLQPRVVAGMPGDALRRQAQGAGQRR